jgi:hypothetical protein
VADVVKLANCELPERYNKRGGPGWWMDLEGVWLSPAAWPEDTAPLDGWVREPGGSWGPPNYVDRAESAPAQRYAVAVETPRAAKTPRRSRQAQADRKAMFTVAGVLGGAALLLAVALILITRASAEDVESKDTTGLVIFAAETDQVRKQRRVEVAALAPNEAVGLLAELSTRDGATDDLSGFDAPVWVAERTECLDIAEQVLVERSQQLVVWADQLGCVPDRGRWSDRYLGTVITRTLDADVTLHVPAAVVYVSGGDSWTDTTLQTYLTDVAHPATLEIVSMGSGHNPRSQDPSTWKPSKESQWCAYAIDWVAVKSRWDLTVTESERRALTTMLDSCGSPSSAGADPATVVIDPLAQPIIERISSE